MLRKNYEQTPVSSWEVKYIHHIWTKFCSRRRLNKHWVEWRCRSRKETVQRLLRSREKRDSNMHPRLVSSYAAFQGSRKGSQQIGLWIWIVHSCVHLQIFKTKFCLSVFHDRLLGMKVHRHTFKYLWPASISRYLDGNYFHVIVLFIQIKATWEDFNDWQVFSINRSVHVSVQPVAELCHHDVQKVGGLIFLKIHQLFVGSTR